MVAPRRGLLRHRVLRRQASATAKRLLPEGTRVRLFAKPATDSVDDFGRLLRYVVRAKDGINHVNSDS